VRARKSLQDHDLSGTEPQYVVADAPPFRGGKPKMPADLSPEAVTEWKRLVKELSKRGTLTRVDSSMLELYVRMWSRWKKVAALAEANPVDDVSWVDKNGTEHFKTIEHPASAMASRLENSLRNMLKELSATPASRERTRPLQQAPPKNAPPHPNSSEGLHRELDRLRALNASENTPAVTPEIDLATIDETAGGTV